MDKDEQQISRRKALGRIGLLATAAYTVPAFATLSMAQAASGNSDASDSSDASEASDGSDASDASDVSDASGVSAASNCETLDASAAANLEDPGYVQCMVDNNFELPADFTYPAGVTLADGTVT